jgi:hypothetical protein
MYKEYDPLEREINIKRTLLHGLLTLTTGRTKGELEEALLEKKRQKEEIIWKDLLEEVIRSEELHGTPNETLHFNGMNSDRTRTFLNFNVNTKLVDDTPGCISPLVNNSL